MLKKISIKKMKPVLGLILFSVAITIIRPNFMTSANLLNVLRQTSINAIIAAGMTFVILTGGIDFKDLKLTLAEAAGDIPAVTLNYGVFIQNVFDFIIIAFAIFMMIKALNKLKKPVEAVKEPSAEEKLLTEIRDLLKK